MTLRFRYRRFRLWCSVVCDGGFVGSLRRMGAYPRVWTLGGLVRKERRRAFELLCEEVTRVSAVPKDVCEGGSEVFVEAYRGSGGADK